MSDGAMGWAGQPGETAASALQEAVEHHRQQLERLAMAVARIERIERIDREVAELNSERASAVQEYEKLYADLTSGRAAGDAIASLGLTVSSKAIGRVKKSSRSPRRAAAKGGRAQRGAAAGQAAAPSGAGGAANERVGEVPSAAGASEGG